METFIFIRWSGLRPTKAWKFSSFLKTSTWIWREPLNVGYQVSQQSKMLTKGACSWHRWQTLLITFERKIGWSILERGNFLKTWRLLTQTRLPKVTRKNKYLVASTPKTVLQPRNICRLKMYNLRKGWKTKKKTAKANENNKFAKLEKSAHKNKITLRNVWDFHAMRAAFSSVMVLPDVQLLRFHFLSTEDVCLLRKQETLRCLIVHITYTAPSLRYSYKEKYEKCSRISLKGFASFFSAEILKPLVGITHDHRTCM